MKNLTSIAKHSDWLDKSPYMNNRKWELHRQRVDFGKQPLALWMFVPCKIVDSVWVVLEEPTHYRRNEIGTIWNDDLKEYRQAKERCLFEGFEIGVYPLDDLLMHRNEFGLPIKDLHRQTIEDLVKYNLELTATAQI